MKNFYMSFELLLDMFLNLFADREDLGVPVCGRLSQVRDDDVHYQIGALGNGHVAIVTRQNTATTNWTFMPEDALPRRRKETHKFLRPPPCVFPCDRDKNKAKRPQT